MHQPGFSRSVFQHCLHHYRPRTMYSLLLSLYSTTTQTFCSLSQMQRALSRASQGATRVRLVFSSSYHFFSFSHSNWVGNWEHIYVCHTRWQMFSQGLMILTLIRAIQSWRTNTNRLFVVLVNHSISYYACGLRELTFVHATFPYSSLFWSVLSGEHIHIATPPGVWISRMPCMLKSLMFRTLVLLPLHVAWVCTSTSCCLFLLTILKLTVSSSWFSPSLPLACTSISGR